MIVVLKIFRCSIYEYSLKKNTKKTPKIIEWIWIWIFGVLRHFQQYFSYIMATSFSGGRSQSTRREPPTMGKQLVR